MRHFARSASQPMALHSFALAQKAEESAVAHPIPKASPLYRLVTNQARIDEDVMNYRYKGSGTEEDPYVVTWIAHDAGNPLNWSKFIRWMILLIMSLSYFTTLFCSTVYSGTVPQITEHFDISVPLATAGTSLFVLGFALGPLLWGPLSEVYGRQFVFCFSFMAFTAFLFGCIAKSSIATLLVLRFFAGCFGSSPIANTGGFIADVFPAKERAFPLSILGLSPAIGSTIGPMVGGYLGQNEGWVWVMNLMAICGGCLWFLGTICVPETYAPVILRKRAKTLSRISGKVYKTKLDIEKAKASVTGAVKIVLFRPWQMLFKEPMIMALSIYMAIVYGTLYLLLAAYPIVFREERGWSQGEGGMALLGIAVGMIAAVLVNPLLNDWQATSTKRNGGVAIPETRLLGCIIGGFAIPMSMFWFAWTSSLSIPWILPVLAGIPFGLGQMLIFFGVTNYLIDAYTCFAASALAANSVLRFLFAAAFPLFTDGMYRKLGVQWASAIPGFLILPMVPAPFIIYKYGARIRERSLYITKAKAVMAGC